MLNTTDKTFPLGEYQLPYSFFADNENGEKGWIIDFINQLFQNIFEISLVMLENENVREFPIAYSERQIYSTIANAIGRLTPYHGSERYFAKNKNNNKRQVDFWCRCIDGQGKIRDIWLECKNLWFNIGKRTEMKITQSCKSKIKECIEQTRTIKDKDEGKIRKDRFKIAFFSTYIYYKAGNKRDNLDNIFKNVYEEIIKVKVFTIPNEENEKQNQSIIDNDIYRPVYSILDLRETIKDEIIGKSWGYLSKDEKDDLVKNNPYQIFLEHANAYAEENENSSDSEEYSSSEHANVFAKNKKKSSDPEGHFMPYMMLVAVIEEFPKNDSSKS